MPDATASKVEPPEALSAPLIVPSDFPKVGPMEISNRAVQVATAFGRHLAGVPLRWIGAGRGSDRASLYGPALRKASQDLGVTFVKLGQILASSPSISGQVLSDEMRGLLDDGPPEPLSELRRTIEEDTGRSFSSLFSEFSPRPHAAASLAVVHRANLLDGTPVAVKVLRPHAASQIASDLTIIGWTLKLLSRQFPIGAMASLPRVVEGLAEQLAEELDLRNEARSMAWFADMTRHIGVSNVRIPVTFAHASGKRVLTMEFISGIAVDDIGSVETLGHDARGAIEDLLKAWFAVTLCTGIFHGDMHAGNLLFTEDGQVAMLDWGILGRLNNDSARFLRRSIQGSLGDEAAWPDIRSHLMSTVGADLVQLTGLSEDDVFALLRSQIQAIMTEPFERLDLLSLMAVSPEARSVLSQPTEKAPKSIWDRLASVLRERRRIRQGGAIPPVQVDRGEMLLVKQLIFFERYGRMYLADRPLIWDVDVFRHLLALSDRRLPNDLTIDPE